MRRLIIFILALAVAGSATAYVAMRSDQFVDDLTGRNVTVMVATREIPANDPVSLSKDIRLQQIDRADVPAGAIVIASESGRDPDLRPYSGHVASRTIAKGAFVRFDDLVPPGATKAPERKDEHLDSSIVAQSKRQLNLLKSDPAVIILDQSVAERAAVARARQLQFVYSTTYPAVIGGNVNTTASTHVVTQGEYTSSTETVDSVVEKIYGTIRREQIIVKKATLQVFDHHISNNKSEKLYYVRLPIELAEKVRLLISSETPASDGGALEIRVPGGEYEPLDTLDVRNTAGWTVDRALRAMRFYGDREGVLCSGLSCTEILRVPEQEETAETQE